MTEIITAVDRDTCKAINQIDNCIRMTKISNDPELLSLLVESRAAIEKVRGLLWDRHCEETRTLSEQ